LVLSGSFSSTFFQRRPDFPIFSFFLSQDDSLPHLVAHYRDKVFKIKLCVFRRPTDFFLNKCFYELLYRLPILRFPVPFPSLSFLFSLSLGSCSRSGLTFFETETSGRSFLWVSPFLFYDFCLRLLPSPVHASFPSVRRSLHFEPCRRSLLKC